MNRSPENNNGRFPHRVAIFYRMDGRGGVQSVIHTLIKGLNRKGIIPDILWDLPPNEDAMREAGVKAGYRPVHFRAPTHLIDRLPDALRYIAWTANAIDGSRFVKDYDFFYIFHNIFLLPQGVPHLRYLSGPPLLPQLETFSPGLKGVPSRLFRALYKGMIRHVAPVYEVHTGGHYVINSQYTADLFKEAHGIELPVVYPPINVSGFSYSERDWSQRDTLTFFSRIVDYKRPEMVLELAARHPGLRTVVMGNVHSKWQNYFEGLKEKAVQLGRPDVIFLPNASFDRVKEELARTRYFVFPGRGEHFGMATAEAIAAGTLPFVHNSGGQREIVPDDRLKFTDETFFAQFDALTQLTEDQVSAIRKRLSAHVQQFGEERFIETMLSYLAESYHEARSLVSSPLESEV